MLSWTVYWIPQDPVSLRMQIVYWISLSWIPPSKLKDLTSPEMPVKYWTQSVGALNETKETHIQRNYLCTYVSTFLIRILSVIFAQFVSHLLLELFQKKVPCIIGAFNLRHFDSPRSPSCACDGETNCSSSSWWSRFNVHYNI